MKKNFFSLSIAVLLLLPCGTFWAEKELIEIKFLPQWTPQAQFAGYMVALEKGFYKEVGINLTLLRGGEDGLFFKRLQDRQCTFGTAWLTAGIQQRSAGVPVVNLAQIVQHSSYMLVGRKSSGIQALGDLQGKKVALWGGDFRIQPLTFFLRNKLDVEVIPLYRTPNLFLKGGVDIVSAMWYNEYHQILNSGFNEDELTTFFFSDHGLNFPEDGIYCLEETYRKNPELCARVVQASIKGWLYAFDHEDEALDIVMKQVNAAHIGTNRAHQRWMLKRMRDAILPGGHSNKIGKLDPQSYAAVTGVLKELNLITSTPSYSEFFKGSE